MATLVLSAVGTAIGGAIGGSVLGLSGAVLGRFAGALIGQSIDQRLLGSGSDAVETGRVSRLRLTGSGEGVPVARVYGRMRVAGHVIWATEFEQNVTVHGGGGGKGARPATPEVREYSYVLSLAIALCEGEISHVGRIWADGSEIAPDSLNMRVYRGTKDQPVDPKMEAVEGRGRMPAYRGTAYVVIEDLDLGPYGNRLPQFSFEVCRPAPDPRDPAQGVRGVALLPGSGEYALATTPVTMDYGPGSKALVNVNSPAGKADMAASLDQLTGELSGCSAVSLVVSWFGSDLRCGRCSIRPKLEQDEYDAANMPWQVAGLTRDTAWLVARDRFDRPVYGGTPTDAAVIEAILGLKQAGQAVMYYPFILMEQMAENGLPDPYSDAPDQPVLPWRGRITLSEAPGRAGSPDGSAVAVQQVAAFFGTARAADFSIQPVTTEREPSGAKDLLSFGGAVKHSPVQYSGTDEWCYRRFILHQAALCKAAGGVESFCIGSEMRGLTQIRGPGNSFPAVAQLVALAAEVRALLGRQVKISYAADWSEYSGYQPGNGDRFFPLDPLWADENIDFIGIDNYMPLSDWRGGQDHADAIWGSIHDLDYLQANIEGGEGYDWYYHSPAAREAQIRTPITDGSGEAWIWRYKDIRNWWQNAHHERIGGVRHADPTAWQPGSKPIRFTEYGCAAIDKGSNQPNRFLDPKSSESALPYFSDGARDDLMQFQYLRAMAGYWCDPAHNPQAAAYAGRMLDWEHSYAWAWDARPFPAFPHNRDLWEDGGNYAQGHWLSGRASARTLASVVEEICTRAGVLHLDTSRLHGLVRGYAEGQASEARAALQPLELRYGFDAVEREGVLRFVGRDGLSTHDIDPDRLVRERAAAPVEHVRGNAAELAGRVRLRFVEAEADYELAAAEAILPDEASHAVAVSEVPLLMTRREGRQVVERWLAEARLAQETLRLTLPPSRLDLGAGDVVTLERGHYRIDRVDLGQGQQVEAVRVEPETYRPVQLREEDVRVRPFVVPVPVTPLFLDLPLMADELPHAPHLVAMAKPWPGGAIIYSARNADADYRLNTVQILRTPVGITQTPLRPACAGRYDRGDGVIVKMLQGGLESIDAPALLAGGNLCAIGDGTPGGWELFQFRDAALVDRDTYRLYHRLRGQLGTEAEAAQGWPEGSYVVRLDGTPKQIGLRLHELQQAKHYRIGPAGRPVEDPAYQHAVIAFDGIGLRPYAPVHLRAEWRGGDLHVHWVRRSRTGRDVWTAEQPAEQPLGEERERYLVRVLQAGAVLREAEVDRPEWIYASAASGALELRVAQISAQVGPGREARLRVG